LKTDPESEKVEKEITQDAESPEQEAKNEEISKPADETASLTEQIQKLEAEKVEMKDQFLRKYADFENFRKRLLRDKEDAVKFANTSLLTDLINVLDDFERAGAAARATKDFDSLINGVELIEKQLLGLLEKKWGLKKFVPLGDPFDPERHEALMMAESQDVKEPVVAEVFQNGYILSDRVIRHAKVKVSMPAKEAEKIE